MTKKNILIKNIGKCVIYCFIIIVANFSVLYSFFHCLKEFKVVNDNLAINLSLYIGLGGTFAFFVLKWVLQKKLSAKNSIRLSNTLSKYLHILLTGIIFLNLTFFSIRRELFLDSTEAKSLLAIEWSITGLSITIFLFWYVVIIKLIEKSKPKQEKIKGSIFDTINNDYGYILDKANYNINTNSMFIVVNVLVLNIFLLLVATLVVYLSPKEITVVDQNIVIAAFYTSSNSLFTLFMHIVVMLYNEKKEIQNEMKVTQTDLKRIESYSNLVEQLKNINDSIDGIDSFSQEYKKKIKEDLLNIVLASLSDVLKNQESDTISKDLKDEELEKGS